MADSAEGRILELETINESLKAQYDNMVVSYNRVSDEHFSLKLTHDNLQTNYRDLQNAYNALQNSFKQQGAELEMAKSRPQATTFEALVIQALSSSDIDNVICAHVDDRVRRWLSDYDMQKQIDEQVSDRIETQVRECFESAVEGYDCESEVEDAVREAVERALESVTIKFNARY